MSMLGEPSQDPDRLGPDESLHTAAPLAPTLPPMAPMSAAAPAPLAGVPAAPVSEAERLPVLDVLRGLALFGIFMVNMPLFAMTMVRGFGGPELVDAPRGEQIAWWIGSVFFQFKFISMFSMLFGVGFAVQLERAQARGLSVAGPYLRRSATLLVIGLVHALLIWHGDILCVYAVAGLLLLALGRLPARTLIWISVGMLAFSSLILTGFSLLGAAMAAYPTELPDGADAGVLRGWEAMMAAQFNPADPRWEAAEALAFREGPLAEAVLFRAMLWGFGLVQGVFSWIWHCVALFLLGAALWKLRFFSESQARWQRLFAWLLPVGLASQFLVSWATMRSGWSPTVASSLLMPVLTFGAVALMLSYVGVVCRLVHAAPRLWIFNAIGKLGRMGLTGYLAESVLASAIMYWWGLGWFGEVDRPLQIALVVIIWLGLVVFANAWFALFRFGPVEWLWRSATYWKWQPLLRRG